MLIIIALFIIQYILFRRVKQYTGTSIYLYICIILFQMILLVLYRAELSLLWNRDVYWSDAQVYWENTLQWVKEGVFYTKAYNPFYIFVSWIIQKTSLWNTPLWNNIANVSFLNITFLLLVASNSKDIPCYSNSVRRNLYYCLILCSIANPLVVYALLRNLKDALFLLLIAINIYIYFFFVYKNGNLSHFIFIIISILLMVVFKNIRPWAPVVPIILYVSFITKNRNNIKYIYILAFALISTSFLVEYYKTIDLWFNYRDEINEIATGTKLSFFSPFRLIMGPGPMRSLNGSEVFLYFTFLGNICSFMGSLIWYFVLPYITCIIFLNYKNIFHKDKSIILLVIVFILVYSIFYGGSAELRHRGVLYPLLAYVVYQSLQKEEHVYTPSYLMYSLASLLIIVPPLLFSM